MRVTDENGDPVTATTDEDGNYRFDESRASAE